MNIREYIDSGILESYVMGSASESEAGQLLRYKEQYPEIQDALQELEIDMELLAAEMAILPPPHLWTKISDNIDNLIIAPKTEPLRFTPDEKGDDYNATTNGQNKFIEVEYLDSHMRIHKTWRWVFAAVFILAKIFLACSIYFYLENRQAQEQIKELKSELKQIK